MKKLFTSALLSVCMLLAFAQTSNAQTPVYYVVSGTPFKLTPATNTLAKFIWQIDQAAPVEQIIGNGVTGVLSHTFNSGGTTAISHTVKLSVLNVLDGCVSDPISYTIVELPKLVVNLSDVVTQFCVGASSLPNNLQITASLKDIPVLGSLGVTLSPFKWTKVGGSILEADLTGTNKETLKVTALGEYVATIDYVLPGTGTTLLGIAVTTASKTFEANLPLPVLPTITIGL